MYVEYRKNAEMAENKVCIDVRGDGDVHRRFSKEIRILPAGVKISQPFKKMTGNVTMCDHKMRILKTLDVRTCLC